MDSKKVIFEIKKLYPGKTIVKIPENNPTEIICEIEPTKNHSNYSVAIAVINKSKSHKHIKSTETYEVIKGELNLFVENKKIILKKGEEYSVIPNKVHWAEGKETWVKVTSTPGWTIKDHLLS